MLALLIGVIAIGCSLPIGIILALARQSDLLIVKAISVGFIEFIRGVPLITLLFVASTLLNIFLPPGSDFDIILRVIIMVTLFASAYMAEVIRGGLASLPRGQYEGADSLGLDYWQAQRLIIMPQALKVSIPGIVSTFIGVFKDTTLVSIIGLMDPLGLSQGIRANAEWQGIYWELFAFIALLFFVVCFSMSRYSMYLERKLQTDNR
jgi:general L-amino acid transport system permease protein